MSRVLIFPLFVGQLHVSSETWFCYIFRTVGKIKESVKKCIEYMLKIRLMYKKPLCVFNILTNIKCTEKWIIVLKKPSLIQWRLNDCFKIFVYISPCLHWTIVLKSTKIKVISSHFGDTIWNLNYIPLHFYYKKNFSPICYFVV